MDHFSPTSIANQALNVAGLPFFLGDIQEGTRAAQVCLRAYTECFRQLIRGCHWDWARREVPLVLLADASMQTPNVGTIVPAGFLYEYAYPTDCAKLRFIPANYWNLSPPIPSPNIVPPDSEAPLTTGIGQPPWVGQRLVPSRFLITSDPNYVGEASNDIQGISPIGRTVILSNIQNARGVYTFEGSYPNLWDSLFRNAMVNYLASEICFALYDNKQLGLKIATALAAKAMVAVQSARTTNGNESWANADLNVDWMRVRSSGSWFTNWGNNWGAGPGCLFGGYDGIAFVGNTAAF